MYSGFLQGFAVTSWTLAVHSISDEEDSEFDSGGESSCVSDDRGGLLKPPDRQQSWLQSERCRQDHKEEQESHAVAGKPRDAAVNSDRYRVCWHFAGAISVSQMPSVSGCTVYA